MTNSHKKIELLWLHSHFLYWMGGTKFIYYVAQHLLQSGGISSITIIVDQVDQAVKSNFSNLTGVKVISLNLPTSTSIWYWISLPFGILFRAKLINDYIAKNVPDKKKLAIISSMFPMNAVAALINKPHLQNCYEPFAFFYDAEFVQHFSFIKKVFISAIKIFSVPIDIIATRHAHRVVTLNSVTQSQVKSVYGIDSVCTQAGVDSKLFTPYVSPAVSEKYHNRQILIHSTDYSPVKGTDLVMRAFAQVVSQFPQANLLITSTIKNESAEKKLKQLAKNLGIEKNIEFLGFVSIEELPQLYSLALALVQGSYSAKSGTTSMALPVKEAMCCGTPAIRPKAGSEDTLHGLTGFICDPRNTQQMANYMKFFLQNPALARNMGSWSRKFITNRYTWARTGEVFLTELQKIV